MFYNFNSPTFKNVLSKCYIAKKLDSTFDDFGNETTQYDVPIRYKFNIQPITAESDIQEFGERIGSMRRAIINRDLYEGKFNEFDLAYLDGATPDNESVNGENANYRVYSVRPQNVAIAVYFLKLVK